MRFIASLSLAAILSISSQVQAQALTQFATPRPVATPPIAVADVPASPIPTATPNITACPADTLAGAASFALSTAPTAAARPALRLFSADKPFVRQSMSALFANSDAASEESCSAPLDKTLADAPVPFASADNAEAIAVDAAEYVSAEVEEPKGPSEQCLKYLNSVRYLCAESNKYDDRFFWCKAQWNIRAKWHWVRQKTCKARSCVILGNEKITPDDWVAAGCAVLDTTDGYGQRWGNCAEQASTVAGLIYQSHDTAIWVRVCYSSCHAWTEVSDDLKTVHYLDPWGDTAGTVGDDENFPPSTKECTAWYRRTGKADPKWEKKDFVKAAG